jgi:hypothetical protein
MPREGARAVSGVPLSSRLCELSNWRRVGRVQMKEDDQPTRSPL